MEKLSLFYKELKLGELSYKDGFYFYNSSNEESLAKIKYVGLFNYNLFNSENRKSSVLFDFFKLEFLDKILNNASLLKLLNKNKKDFDFDILLEFSKLNQTKFGFSLKLIK